jgi:uroporphyrinogen decarboxylase
VETTIGLRIGERLLGKTLPLVLIPHLGLSLRHWEDDKKLSRLLHRDNISFRLLPPTFSKKERGKEGQVFVGDGLIKTMDDFQKIFSLPNPAEDSVYEPIKPILERRDEFAVIFSTRLGFLSALISIGFQTFMESLYLNPELIDAVMRAYVDWSAKVIRRVCDMGVDAVFTTDDFAFNGGPFLSPAAFRQWVIPYHRRASEEITVPWIVHTDGEISAIVEDLLSLGISGIHPIDPNCMDIRAFKRKFGERVCILGNVNLNTLGAGTPEETYSEVRNLIRDLAPGYGYILSSGNSVPDYVRPENMLALAKAIEDFGSYPI